MIRTILGKLYHRCEALPLVGKIFPYLRNMYRQLTGRSRILLVNMETNSSREHEPILAEIVVEKLRMLEEEANSNREHEPILAEISDIREFKASNSISTSKLVMEEALSSLGVAPKGHAVVEKLRMLEEEANSKIDWSYAESHPDPIVRFQAALKFMRDGETGKSRDLFRSIAEDEHLEQRFYFSPDYTSAYIRAVEIYGQTLQDEGRDTQALDLYRKVLGKGGVAPHLSFKASVLADKLGLDGEAKDFAAGLQHSDNNLSHDRTPNSILSRLLDNISRKKRADEARC